MTEMLQGKMHMIARSCKCRFQRLFTSSCIVVLCVAICSGAREAYAQAAMPYEVFCGKSVTNETTFVSEHNLSERLKSVLQYTIVAQDQFFVMGRTRDNELEVALMSASDAYSIVVKYPFSAASIMLDASFAVVRIGGGQRDLCVLVNYTSGNVGNRVEETKTFMDLLCPHGVSGYTLVRREKVAENNISWLRHSVDDESKYLYTAVDDSRRGPGKIEPAIRIVADVTVTDINADGDPDIVVDRKTFKSRRKEDAVSSDFVLVDHEMLAMPYLRAQRRFGEPSVIRDRSVVSDAMERGTQLFQKSTRSHMPPRASKAAPRGQ